MAVFVPCDHQLQKVHLVQAVLIYVAVIKMQPLMGASDIGVYFPVYHVLNFTSQSDSNFCEFGLNVGYSNENKRVK